MQRVSTGKTCVAPRTGISRGPLLAAVRSRAGGGGGPVQTATEHDKFTPHSAGSHTATRLPDTTTAVRFRRVTEGENAQPFEKAIKVPLPFLTACLREARFPSCTSPKTTYHTQKRMLE